jgi:RNA-directed DNA polymerase
VRNGKNKIQNAAKGRAQNVLPPRLLAKFFDTVNHDVLMNLLRRTIADKQLLTLIGRYLRAGVLVGEHVEASEVGTPQGGPISPLLANILLHQLDLELERRGHRFARYADERMQLSGLHDQGQENPLDR